MGPFSILDTEDFTPQTGGEPMNNDATGHFESIVSWGVGVEHRVGPITTLYGSYSLDKSASVTDASAETDLVLTNYDISRYSLGSSFRL